MELGLTGIFAVLFAVSYAREPRRMRCAIFLFGAVSSLTLSVIGALGTAVARRSDVAGAWALLAVLILIIAMVVLVAVMLVLNGLTMVRKEGRRLSNLLSLLLGLGILGAVAAAVGAVSASVVTDSVPLVLGVILLSLPIGFLSYGFLAYLLYSAVYQAITRRRSRQVAAVVALGSGLIEGEVPPLLASRLDGARQAYDAAVATGGHPVIVTSGGQGEDEPRPEAEAMAEYLRERGVPAAAILAEAESRTTQENLANTAALLAERGVVGPVAVVTNNFHAFRAAMMMRKAGVAGYVLGAPTADYYWPSATIREYLAILRDHLWFVVISVGLLSLPAAWFAYSLLS
ncbi:MAG: YdcF family protein [Actinobacteria bacterium]|nr:YdcF family protein [Actinomycetota bacterium]